MRVRFTRHPRPPPERADHPPEDHKADAPNYPCGNPEHCFRAGVGHKPKGSKSHAAQNRAICAPAESVVN